MDADQVRDLVFGLGLNVNSDPASLPAEVRATAGSLAHASGAKADLHAVAAGLIETTLAAYEDFEHAPERADPRKLFDRFDMLRGEKVSVGLRGEPVSGVASGVDERGALRLLVAPGRFLTLNAGEVTLKKRPRGGNAKPADGGV